MEFIKLTKEHLNVFDKALSVMAEFKNAFRRNLGPDMIAEIYVAKELSLNICVGNKPGYDLVGPDNYRYQVKFRDANTQNIDINNFDFDFIVLVNLKEEDFTLKGMWLLTQPAAQSIFSTREKYNKHQVTQKKFKEIAKKIR
jgi:hypothetical protein